jgi:hypothetical protein
MVVRDLRQEEIAGCEGYRESDEVEHCRRLEATRHIKHISEYVHIFWLFDD